jgi:hypothetical protein
MVRFATVVCGMQELMLKRGCLTVLSKTFATKPEKLGVHNVQHRYMDLLWMDKFVTAASGMQELMLKCGGPTVLSKTSVTRQGKTGVGGDRLKYKPSLSNAEAIACLTITF